MKYLFISIILIFFTACSSNVQEKVRSSVQTENAKQVRANYKEIIKLLDSYTKKLDKRNPKSSNERLRKWLRHDIVHNQNTIKILKSKNDIPLSHTAYLNHAFDKQKDVKHRNNYLMIGLYKMLYDAYKMDQKYKMTALSYDIEKLQKAYKNLQVIQWKIKYDKDFRGDYLFLTWQNNWQVELEKMLKVKSLDEVNLSELTSIKSKRESILDSSNGSFEVLTSKMLLYMASSLRMLNAEPEDLSIEAIMKVLFII